MFKFNTTTIINSNQDFTSKVIDKTTGKPGIPLFTGQEEQTTESGKPVYANFSVKRHLTFLEPFVKAIYFREHNDPELAKVEVELDGTVDTTKAGLYRIAMYIGLEGSANEYYANDYVFKGKPFFIEFTVKKNEEAADIAKKVEKIAKKYMQMLYEYPLINVTAEGTKVVFEATDEYQRFRMVELQEFDEEKGLVNACCGHAGDFNTIAELNVNATKEEGNDGDIVWAEEDDLLKGKAGFGTYRQIIKDLRLPTPDNRRWGGIIADETPVPGATYDQYTIYYCRRVGVQGLAHVGDVVTALTSHIFYVNTAVKSEWDEALASLGIDVTEVTNDQYTLTPNELEIDAAKKAKKAQQNTDSGQDTGIGTNAGDIDTINSEITSIKERLTALEQ